MLVRVPALSKYCSTILRNEAPSDSVEKEYLFLLMKLNEVLIILEIKILIFINKKMFKLVKQLEKWRQLYQNYKFVETKTIYYK